MKQLVFATNNAHKLDEVRNIVGDTFDILSLEQIGCHDDIEETADTFEGNALIKARYIKEKYGYDCFADDTGLMVDALGGAPGVYSARYAGDGHDSAANMALLLHNMQGVTDRHAHFSTVIALVTGSDIRFFEGSVYGVITEEPDGAGGFGYDPVFLPDEDTVTFASMPPDRKNAISHRGRATAKLIDYLTSI